jgi:hypothetical protein
MDEENEKSAGVVGLWTEQLRRLLCRLPATNNRLLAREIVAAFMLALPGAAFFSGGITGAVAGLALGAAAGVVVVGRYGARGWAVVWLCCGAVVGGLVGSLEGLLYALVWLVPAMVWHGSLGLCLWVWIDRRHEATVKRLVHGVFGMLITPVAFAVPMGMMGLLDLGFSDDVFGIMAMVAIFGALFGLVTGWRSVVAVSCSCSVCNKMNQVPHGLALQDAVCFWCRSHLQGIDTGAIAPFSLARAWCMTLSGAAKGALVHGVICLSWGGGLGAGVGWLLAQQHHFATTAGLADGAWRGIHAGGLAGIALGAFVGAWRPMVRAMSQTVVPTRSDHAQTGGGVTLRWFAEPFFCLILVVGLGLEIHANPTRQLFMLEGPYGLEGLALTAQGRLLTVTGDQLLSWDLESGEQSVQSADLGQLTAVAVAANGRFLAFWGGGSAWSGESAGVEICSGDGSQILHRLPGLARTEVMAFSPDSQILAVGGGDSSLVLWDTETWSQKNKVQLSASPLALAFSPDGRRLAIAQDRDISLWDIGGRQAVMVLQGHRGAVRCLAFAADGVLLASGGMDRSVRLWNTDTGIEQLVLGGINAGDQHYRHRDYVLSLAFVAGDFIAEGQLLAAGDASGMITLWDYGSGREQAVLGGYEEYPLWALWGGHTNAVTQLVFADRLLVAGGQDGTLRFWRY